MTKPLTQEEEHLLITSALNAMQNSYSPYSNFKVGAAVLTDSGRIFAGTNVENSSYGLAVCAERNAIFSAVGSGARKFKGLALVTKKVPGAEFNSPCGACRQVMSEFFDPDTPVYMVVLNGNKQETFKKSFEEVLPFPFPKLTDK